MVAAGPQVTSLVPGTMCCHSITGKICTGLWSGNRLFKEKKNVKQKCELFLKEAHPWVLACVCWLWDYTENSSSMFLKKQRVQKFSMKEKNPGRSVWLCCCVLLRVTARHRFPATDSRPLCTVFLSSLCSVNSVKCQLLGL